MSSMKASRTKVGKPSNSNGFPKKVSKGKPTMGANGGTKNAPSGGKKAMHGSNTGHNGFPT